MVTPFDPKGKTFDQRLTAFLADAKATHGVTVGKDSGRTVANQWVRSCLLPFPYAALFNYGQSTKGC